MRTSVVLPVLALCGFTAPIQAGRLVAVDSDRRLYEISPTTGAKTHIGSVSANAGVTAGSSGGARSAKAAQYYRTQGIDAVNVAGGTRAWIDAGLPTDSDAGSGADTS